MRIEKRKAPAGCLPLGLFLLIVLMAGSTGCIKIAQNAISGGSATGNISITPVVTAIPNTSPSVIPQSNLTADPGVFMTPAMSDIVTEVTPDVTPDPYVFPNATKINETPLQPAFQYLRPQFTKTYTLTGNAVGLLVNVAQGPLYVVYMVNPKFDCLADPDSCRGTILVPVNNPYMSITIRDNQTNEIVAEDGYGRQYSSDIGHYEISTTGYTTTSVNGQTTVSTTSLPGPRFIPVYSSGQFQITIQGNYLDVTVAIVTGTAPNPLDALEKSGGTVPVSDSDDN
ncbi:MAG: hypothetical protein WCA60_03580 [Methanoregula sp.]|uniref:hypothetical protein n=1 Tax=Methanoregula sp. TaxID=2052170 RepID=UPI003BB12C39